MRSRTLRALLVSAALVLVDACGSPNPTVAPTSTPAGASSSSVAVVHGLRVTLELARTSVKAGTPIPAMLVVDNLTRRAITSPCGVDYAVGLSNSQIFFNPAFAAMCQLHQSIAAGITRVKLTIITTYSACSQGGQPDGPMPGCLPGPMGAGSHFTVAPPLPRGTYRTSVVIDGLPSRDVAIPGPIAVTLT